MILDALIQEKHDLIGYLSGAPFDQLMQEFTNQDNPIRIGNSNVYILYGREPLFTTEDGQIAIDVRGLVFKPHVRVSRNKNIVVDL